VSSESYCILQEVFRKYFAPFKILFNSILKIQNKILSRNYFKIKNKILFCIFKIKIVFFKIVFCPSLEMIAVQTHNKILK